MCKGRTLEVQEPQYVDRLARALQLNRRPTELEAAVNGSITLLDLTDPEYLYLARIRQYMSSVEQGAVAAQNNFQEFRNLPGSGLLARVLVELDNSNATIQGFFVGIGVTPLLAATHVTRVQSVDTRQGGGTAAGCLVYQHQAVLAGAATDLQINVPPNTRFLIGPFVVGEDRYLKVTTNTVNIPSGVRFIWTERAPSQQELV